MPTLFTKIIRNEIPGRFVWSDDRAVAFLTIEPLRPGHVLVVPRAEIPVWTQLDPDLLDHLMSVAQTIGQAQQAEWGCPFVGLLIAGFDVPHVHLHVWPTWGPQDHDLRNAERDPASEAMDEAARRLRAALRKLGVQGAVPAEPGEAEAE